MYYWTPKRIKELKAAGYKLHASPASLVKKSDQAISSQKTVDVGDSVRPGPGLKQQASSTKLLKKQATSIKRQDPGPWKKFHGPVSEVLYQDK